MTFQIARFFGNRHDPATGLSRPRLEISKWPAAIYAIGDIHGCVAQLRLLHRKILDDASSIEGEKLIVCLGDYVDRGLDSAGVLDFLTSGVPTGFRRVCLAGNHEIMMLEHLADPRLNDRWLSLGGIETLISYGIQPAHYMGANTKGRSAMLTSHIPTHHLEFLHSLPLLLALPGVVLVHAGIKAGIPLAEQDDNDLLWSRERPDTNAALKDAPFVVHGHMPAAEPVIVGNDIGIDTGAFATGVLTAVRLRFGETPVFINVGVRDRS